MNPTGLLLTRGPCLLGTTRPRLVSSCIGECFQSQHSEFRNRPSCGLISKLEILLWNVLCRITTGQISPMPILPKTSRPSSSIQTTGQIFSRHPVQGNHSILTLSMPSSLFSLSFKVLQLRRTCLQTASTCLILYNQCVMFIYRKWNNTYSRPDCYCILYTVYT